MDSNLLRPASGLISHPVSHGMGWVLLLACAVSSGCATAINGTTQRVAVASDPPGAQVYVNETPAGVTPGFVDVPRRDPDLELRLEKEGYEPTVLALERSRSGWVAGNVLFAGVPVNEVTLEMWVGAMAVCGILGSLWDAKRGGAYKRPGLVRATLDPVRVANGASARGRVSPPPGGVPGVAGSAARNRLVPMRFADRIRRLTGRQTGWDPEPSPRPRPQRP